MYARHDLVWLGEAGWRQASAGVRVDDRNAAAALAAWESAGWPAIVRRADAGAAPGRVALGIPLPPRLEDGHKIRIATSVDAAAILRRAPPLALTEALARAAGQPVGLPSGWPAALAELAEQAASHRLALRVYGSTAMQLLTGQRYLGAASDIDLLLHPRSHAELAAGLALLRDFAVQLPLDGEIVFPGGRAVSWKEWSAVGGDAAGTRVLVKEAARVCLVPVDALLASLEAEPCLD